MLVVAGLVLGVNSFNISLLHSDSYYDLNLRGVLLHIISDAASSLGIILAALAVYFLDWLWADVAASLLVACLLSLSALPLVWDSLRILMEYAPRCIDVGEVEAILSSNACVRQVEKLHIWTITSGQVALCAHLVVESLSAQERDRLAFAVASPLNSQI